MESILFLAPTESDGSLSKAALETLGAATELSSALGASLAVGLFGGEVQNAANSIASCGAKFFGVAGADFAPSRYATDAAAAEALCRAANATLVVTPAGSRTARVMAGVAHRLNGRVDTHATAVTAVGGAVTISRWYYRQRIEATQQRSARPWIILLDSGCHAAWAGAPGAATVEALTPALPQVRTVVTGISAPKSDEQTIRPDAELLFVTGAGWTKKQADGQVHAHEAETLILDFLRKSKASLGGSKSVVDQGSEGQPLLLLVMYIKTNTKRTAAVEDSANVEIGGKRHGTIRLAATVEVRHRSRDLRCWRTTGVVTGIGSPYSKVSTCVPQQVREKS
jgi:electron transfer flavoprotein alpha subunit